MSDPDATTTRVVALLSSDNKEKRPLTIALGIISGDPGGSAAFKSKNARRSEKPLANSQGSSAYSMLDIMNCDYKLEYKLPYM